LDPIAYIGDMETPEQHHDYRRIEKALVYLDANRDARPDLEAVAEHVGLSPFHFQRLFNRWVGISPKRFLQYLTVEHARACLSETRSVLDAAYEAGLSSAGRLHDLMVAVDAVTPGEFRSGGEGLTIRHGFLTSPFGRCFIGATERGVCWLSFAGDDDPSPVAELEHHFRRARLVEDQAAVTVWRDRVFARSEADKTPPRVLLSGTNFQLKVWEGLLSIPAGRLCSYADLAAMIGRPTATRASGVITTQAPSALSSST